MDQRINEIIWQRNFYPNIGFSKTYKRFTNFSKVSTQQKLYLSTLNHTQSAPMDGAARDIGPGDRKSDILCAIAQLLERIKSLWANVRLLQDWAYISSMDTHRPLEQDWPVPNQLPPGCHYSLSFVRQIHFHTFADVALIKATFVIHMHNNIIPQCLRTLSFLLSFFYSIAWIRIQVHQHLKYMDRGELKKSCMDIKIKENLRENNNKNALDVEC